MVKVTLDYMSEFPKVRLVDDPETTPKEKELFKTKIIPSMQKEIDLIFGQFERNSSELAMRVRATMNHDDALEKARYAFAYYTNENKVGMYWYEKASQVE